MKPLHVFLGVLVACVWGFGFIANKVALDSFSPAQAVGLRFAIAAFPVLFLPRPNVPWSMLIAISMTLFAAQFLFQFLGLAHGMPVGLSAIVVQTQAIFTVVMAAALLSERPSPRELAGIALGSAGLGLIALTVGQGMSAAGFLFTLVSPIVFAIGNILLKRLRDVDMFSLTAWLSVVVPLPSFALSALLEGPADLPRALTHASWLGWGAILYVALASTTVAYTVWGGLLSRYSAASVAPYALLVPVVGAAAGAVVLGERFGALQLAGMACVLAGLAVIVLAGRKAPLAPPGD